MNVCPRCGYPGSDPRATAAGRKGGKVRGAKGFAVSGQPSAEARKRAWATRKRRQEAIHGHV